MIQQQHDVGKNESDDSSSDGDFAFDSLDLSGVDFDNVATPTTFDESALAAERRVLLSCSFNLDGATVHYSANDTAAQSNINTKEHHSEHAASSSIQELENYLAEGKYCEILRGTFAQEFFHGLEPSGTAGTLVASTLRDRVLSICTDSTSCVKVEFLAIAALNLFLQLNYTGPSLEKMAKEHMMNDDLGMSNNPLRGIDPHPCFVKLLHGDTDQEQDTEKNDFLLTAPRRNTNYQNSVLTELAVDGDWPSQTCQVPYLLLLARSILATLANPSRPQWTHAVGSTTTTTTNNNNIQDSILPESFAVASSQLFAVHLWSARAVVAHQRLLQSRKGESSVTLWDETQYIFQTNILTKFCANLEMEIDDETFDRRVQAATVMLEWGLAQHHFYQPNSKLAFQKAMDYSLVKVEVTGAVGKRTKFQQEATAQMLVKAVSSTRPKNTGSEEEKRKIKAQMVEHSEEEILLERINYDNTQENEIQHLSILDQAILLSLCLDVKNNNPADGLTGEQMGAYLARVLDHHDDWMVYSTALLERSWLEFERSHGRERAILQMQALSDQHTNRLTITQSTFESIEESAPVQDRLRNLHIIVYPPRWSMLADLAERYAAMGIVTSAAEIFADIEMWDEVVECYTRAGKSSKAEQIVRERLAKMETPRMWAALGDITNEPEHYEKALKLSNGRFSNAYVSLGKFYFEQSEIVKAAEYYRKAVKIRPLLPSVWFRLGTISMQLKDWAAALSAFTEVVQQEPQEADAWANVAAVHMHNKNPSEAYPALNESLKYNRNNWRVWNSKLYTCIDLKKYDEAIQACQTLLDLKATTNYAEKIPDLEEKCVRAIVVATLKIFQDHREDKVALDSARRTLSRLHDLLDRMTSSAKAEPWVWETFAMFNEAVGRDEEVLENLMKEYRSLQANKGWETDQFQVQKVIQVVAHISHFHTSDGSKDSLIKCRFLLRGVINKIKQAYMDASKIPSELEKLENILLDVECNLESMK